jgi:hypothetical protein
MDLCSRLDCSFADLWLCRYNMYFMSSKGDCAHVGVRLGVLLYLDTQGGWWLWARDSLGDPIARSFVGLRDGGCSIFLPELALTH